MTGEPCPFCCGSSHDFGRDVLLGHVDAAYSRCAACGSVFLPRPTWLEEAYSSAITSLDVGLLERCLQLANITHAVLRSERLRDGRFLDFAGGYGTLTRLMRDRGFAFAHHDPHCENVFAPQFEGDLSGRYDVVTAYEVLEHLTDPAATLHPVSTVTDLLLVTTQVLPDPPPVPGSWDYYAPEAGQHITFATVRGLRALATTLGYTLTTSGRLVHAFHRRPLRRATRLLLRDERLAYACGAVLGEPGRRRGLTLADSRAAAQALRQD